MTKRHEFPVDADGNIVGQKVIVGCDKDHYIGGRSRPFPDRGINWLGENRVLVRVRVGPRRVRGQAFSLDDALL
jgi:hypothetical protein